MHSSAERIAITVNPDDVDKWWVRVGPRLEQIVARSAEVTATLAERYLVAHAAANGVEVTPVRALPPREQIATSLRVSGPVAWKIAFADSRGDVGRATATMRTRLAGAAVRLALAGDRNTAMATISAGV